MSLALLVLAVREPERPEAPGAVRSPLSLAELKRLGSSYWWVVAIATVFTLARFSEAFLLLRAQAAGLPVALIPMVLVAMNVVYALAAYPAGVFSDRVNRIGVLGFGFLTLIAADLVLAFAPGLTMVALGVVLWGLHMGFTQGLLATLVADTAPPELRGTAYGLFNLFGGVATLAASMTAGALWDRIGPSVTFAAGAGFTALALIGLMVIGRRAPHIGQAHMT